MVAQQAKFRRRARGTIRRGFTLLEVAIAIVVIAVGVVAVQGLVGATTSVTAVSNELQTATMLSNAMHERCLGLDRTSLLALNGVTYSPPMDSQAVRLTEFPDFTQTVTVSYVSPRSIGTTSTTATDLLRVTVAVARNNKPVVSTSRLIATTKDE